MRTIFGTAGWLISLALVCATPQAMAETNYIQNNQQFGVNLPQVGLPTGSDEIRTTDGASCRSAVGGNGAYMDMGVIASPENEDANASAAAYGRVVIPLGYKAKRLDCSKLYNLEIQRLKMELELARMGSTGGATTQAAPMNSNWAEDGWNSQPAGVVYPDPKTHKAIKKKPVVQPDVLSGGLYE
jgi:hypothetical protein